jgi:uncharacterized protein (TIGR04255 family)
MGRCELSGGGRVFRAESKSGLPTKLAKEPLVDAIFEVRFDSSLPVASIWPGMLYSALPQPISLENLPAVGIPKEIRDNDPNLAFVPLAKLSIDNYWVMVGDRVFAVAAKVPYPGWEAFKATIMTALGIVLQTPFVNSISRCSIKYIDILDSVPLEPSACFNLNLDLGGRSPLKNDFHVRLGFHEDGITHNLQVAAKAVVTIVDGNTLTGPVLDVDSVIEIASETPSAFMEKLAARAQALHDSNKRLVFESLSAEALAFLEPTYE